MFITHVFIINVFTLFPPNVFITLRWLHVMSSAHWAHGRARHEKVCNRKVWENANEKVCIWNSMPMKKVCEWKSMQGYQWYFPHDSWNMVSSCEYSWKVCNWKSMQLEKYATGKVCDRINDIWKKVFDGWHIVSSGEDSWCRANDKLLTHIISHIMRCTWKYKYKYTNVNIQIQINKYNFAKRGPSWPNWWG